MGIRVDLTGKKFGRLTCVAPNGKDKFNRTIWHCVCDCGNECDVRGYRMTNGNTKSCGCLHREGLVRRNSIHSLSLGPSGKVSRLYQIWLAMKKRCGNPNDSGYQRYGGRGIEICNEWKDYKKFHEWSMDKGYSDELSIDRIDNNRGYEPENCRWVTNSIQQRNKRNNHLICFQGETKTLTEWSELAGMESSLLRYRLKSGWSVENALLIPVKKQVRKGRK